MSRCDSALDPGVIESLAARRRRYVLEYLSNAPASEVPVDALVDHVLEQEAHSRAPDGEAVAATLHHRHLPKLDEAGLVDYDIEHGSITITADTALAEPYLEFARRWESGSEA